MATDKERHKKLATKGSTPGVELLVANFLGLFQKISTDKEKASKNAWWFVSANVGISLLVLMVQLFQIYSKMRSVGFLGT